LDRYIAAFRNLASTLPDKRTGANARYPMVDIATSAFTLFFMQFSSFLAFQRILHKNKGQDNTQTLFHIKNIPTDNHIRYMLDGIDPKHFDALFIFILEDLMTKFSGVVHNSLENHTLIALDGTEYFSSRKISCQHCSTRMRSDGNNEYYHSFLSATIVRINTSTIFPLPPEFIIPQDGDIKQDCEYKAVMRWFDRYADFCKKLNPVYLGDDLYAKQGICSRILKDGGNFIFTCKDSSHKTLCEFRKGLKAAQHVEKVVRGKQISEYRYSWIEDLPIRDGDEALLVNWIDVEIVNSKGKVTYHASFITNIKPNHCNISQLISSARARWKIENETFNVLKNNGYHLEHNFGHGKTTLSSVLVVMNLLAFAMHNACDTAEDLWQEARAQVKSRVRLFIHMWTLTTYHVFKSWKMLMRTIITGVPPP
jgi:hypothetical protein